jgi:Uma2 family endonuclease
MNPTPPQTARKFDYPTSDGRPMAETELHADLLVDLIRTLRGYYQDEPMVCVSGNILVHYQPGNRRRHVSPDVFVVFGVPARRRDYYLLWEEKPLDLVIELTSASTRREDTEEKMALYQDVLKVKEYFLFDPRGEYLDPPLQGYRLRAGHYRPIRPRQRRLPSQTLGLHLEQVGDQLRLYDPATGQWLPTPAERTVRAEQAQQEAEAGRQRAEQAQREAQEDRQRAEQESERLRHEVEELRRRLGERQ